MPIRPAENGENGGIWDTRVMRQKDSRNKIGFGEQQISVLESGWSVAQRSCGIHDAHNLQDW